MEGQLACAITTSPIDKVGLLCQNALANARSQICTATTKEGDCI